MSAPATALQAGRAVSGDQTAWRTRLGFLLGALGPSMGFQLVIVLALRFMTDSLAIPAALAGSAMALTRVFDAVVDPAIGWSSDRTRTRWGRRRPYFVASAVLMPVSAALLFNPPTLATGGVVAFLSVCLMLNAASYSAFTVPYVASASEIAGDYHERSVLMSFRTIGLTLGLMTASTLAPWLLAAQGSGRAAHGFMGLVMAVLMFAALAGATVMIPEPAPAPHRDDRAGLGGRLKTAWGNKPFRLVVLAHMGFQIGVGAVLVSTAYFSRQVLHVSDVWLGSFYLAKSVGNLVSVPLWLWLSRRFDKKAAYMVSLVSYGLFNLSWILGPTVQPLALVLGRMFLIGVGMGGCVLLSSSVITDVIRYEALRTGLRQEGIFAGVVSFVDKAFQAAGVALVGFVLSFTGYVASAHGVQARQPPSAIAGVYIGFSLTPAVAAALCILAMWGYKLKESDFAALSAARSPTPDLA